MTQRALVLGASTGVGRATALALLRRGTAVTAVARDPHGLVGLDGATPRAGDATQAEFIRDLLAEVDPELVVIAAGARPQMLPVHEQSWESFSIAWNTDVKIAFEVGGAALRQPLRPGATVIVVSSGAGLGGSPLTGGYAGAKRMQQFLASYLQREAAARNLGLRFVAVAPRQFIVGTEIAATSAAAYAREAGVAVDEYLKRFPVPLDADGVAAALLAVADGTAGASATLLGLTGKGLEVL